MRFLDAGEVLALANAIRPDHYRSLVLTAAYVGLRSGELAGLRVENVDLLRKQIRVERQVLQVKGGVKFGPPKTKAGRRTVSIPASLVDILEKHIATDAVQRSGLAFPTVNGMVMRRQNFAKLWDKALTALRWTTERDEDTDEVVHEHRLSGLTLHELRHTAAALAIEQGAHPMAIKERLGHSSINVTLDRYGHLFPRLDLAIAEGLDGVLRESLAANPRPVPSNVLHLTR
jgi:integrase